jgi:hypothetical protein
MDTVSRSPHMGLPVPCRYGILGYMNDTTVPTDWSVLVVPSDWDPDNPTGEVRTVHTGPPRPGTLPASFVMSIQTPAMHTDKDPAYIFANFETDSSGVELTGITGHGDWLTHLGSVVAEFPPAAWQEQAEVLAVLFVIQPERRLTSAAARVSKAALPVTVRVGLGKTYTQGKDLMKRRRLITPEHLRRVARVYENAQVLGEPPTQAVQKDFEVSHSTAAKWVGRARDEGFLPPHEKAED